MTPIKRVPANQLELRWYDVADDGYPPLDEGCDLASVDVIVVIGGLRKVAYHMASSFDKYWITLGKKNKVVAETLVTKWCPTMPLPK